VHSDLQPATSYMNRICGQIGFASDESNLAAPALLPKELRPDFHQWSQARYSASGDQAFNLAPQDVPRRRLHGMALREMFFSYVQLLRSTEGVSVDLYDAEVTDVLPGGQAGVYTVHASLPGGFSLPAHHLLFATGHSSGQRPSALPWTGPAPPPESRRYIPQAYPLEHQLAERYVPPGSAVGVLGLGLTAIDIFLYLTEGRGGRFVPAASASGGSSLEYIPSGREPALITAFCPSGLPVTCRPYNLKLPGMEHRGVFFTTGAVRELRKHLGTSVHLPGGREIKQLDFEKHVFPLVILEMAFVYYSTLLGKGFGARLLHCAGERYREFLRHGCTDCATGIDHLLSPVQDCFREAARHISLMAGGHIPSGTANGYTEAYESFRQVLSGTRDEEQQNAPTAAGNASPRGHSTCIHDHIFDWKKILYPLGEEAKQGMDWQAELLAFMEKDYADACQGNLHNPVKAACDGVWRDLRSEFSEVVDHGGLLPASHQRFVSVYLRFYNRLSNGSGMEALRKVRTLASQGFLDLSIGPLPEISYDTGATCFLVRGRQTGTSRKVEYLVEGRVHSFDPETDERPLYRNLLARGLVRKWRNPGSSPSGDFYPGGLDLSTDFHPVMAGGSINRCMSFLGTPAEGVFSFQSTAARPYSNSSVLNNISVWAANLVRTLQPETNTHPTTTPGPVPPVTVFRKRLRDILQAEKAAGSSRNVLVFAVDGIPCELALSSWKKAWTEKLRSLFPTTSSTVWLSCLTGMNVADHGIPGVVFRMEEGQDPVNVFSYKGDIAGIDIGNIFTDALDLGYEPYSIRGDLEQLDCSWRDLLLRSSKAGASLPFFTGDVLPSPRELCGQVRRSVLDTLQAAQGRPCLVWTFIDADQYIHKHGYDDYLLQFLAVFEELAEELAQNAIVIAHSDHGLTPTRSDARVQEILDELQQAHGCAIGGAGRTRWVYCKEEKTESLIALLKSRLPPSVLTGRTAHFFDKDSPSGKRMGNIILVAEGEEFIVPEGYLFDHGSLTGAELFVPCSEWWPVNPTSYPV
jgi:hypothetical protein